MDLYKSVGTFGEKDEQSLDKFLRDYEDYAMYTQLSTKQMITGLLSHFRGRSRPLWRMAVDSCNKAYPDSPNLSDWPVKYYHQAVDFLRANVTTDQNIKLSGFDDFLQCDLILNVESLLLSKSYWT